MRMRFNDLTMEQKKKLFDESREIRSSIINYYRERIHLFIFDLTNDYLNGVINPQKMKYTLGDYLNLICSEIDMKMDLMDGPWAEEVADTLFDFKCEIVAERKGENNEEWNI